jgi:long-chain fatty acid transport protein
MRASPCARIAVLVLLILAVARPRPARAAGFAIAEQGTAATGMAGAFTAKADDPSAVFFNPAGLAGQHKLQVYVGGVLVLGHVSVQGTPSFPLPSEEKALFTAQPLATVYLSYGLPHDVAVGIGVFTNFGLKLEWPAGWSGRYAGQYVSLQTVTINPSAAWRPVRWFSVGVGLDLIPASVDLQMALNLVSADALLRFQGNDLGVGGNVGVLFEGPILWRRERPLFSLGISYRSSFNLNFDNGSFRARAPIEFSQQLKDQSATAELKLPDQLSVGFGVRPFDHLFLQIQFDWVRWSRLQELRLNVNDNPAQSLVLPQQWGQGYVLRFGGELELGRWRARLGVGYDWNPVPAQTLGPFIPDANRVLVTAGLGMMDLPAHLAAELSLMGVIFQTRTSELPTFPVQYSNWALLISGAISYRADRPSVKFGH